MNLYVYCVLRSFHSILITIQIHTKFIGMYCIWDSTSQQQRIIIVVAGQVNSTKYKLHAELSKYIYRRGQRYFA